ncbi:GAF domain-containing protein [Nostoc sp. TCL26-01]|uniref:GAF domain-containing protein n=1 Tax=Nostoc sp. TCL26-01 TaxID=2576904 RepID=UPI0015BE4883|nr:GAF domain-containing protein [Nostoc sp. TCL26-01]QLE58984.1 GAF domain-containing protein [Nostoc sp. TCL26-01]
MNSPQTNILLIDNHLENNNFLIEFFQGTKYFLQRVAADKAVINTIYKSRPDLILLDGAISPSQGQEICQNLKANAQTQDISIILLIFREQLATQWKYFQLGVADFITKPLQKEECLLRIQNYLATQNLYKNLGKNNYQLAIITDKENQDKELVTNHQTVGFNADIKNLIIGNNTDTLLTYTSSRYKSIKSKKQTKKDSQSSTIKLCNHNLVLTKLAKNQLLYQDNLKAAFIEITVAGAKNLGVERASVWLYDETGTKIQCIDLFEDSRNQHSEGLVLSVAEYPDYFQALHQDEAIAAEDAHTDPRTQEFSQTYLAEFNIKSMLDTPIRLGGKTVGVLCLEAVGLAHYWTPEDQNFARSLSNLASLALEARERRLAQAAFRISEQKLASAFRASPDPIVLCTFPETRYIEVNDSFCRLFGYSRSQVIGNTDRELNIWVNPEECVFIGQILRQAKVIRNHEVDFRTCGGEIKTALFSAEMIEIDGQKYVLGTAKDITERKQAETESRLLLLTTQAIARAVDVKSALTLVLRLICQTIGWDFAEAWLPNEQGNILEHSLVCYCDESSLEEFCTKSQNITFVSGIGLPGRVWQSKQPEWLEDVSLVKQPYFLRSRQAAKVGLKAGFGVPILAEREVLAVLGFFKRTPVPLDRRLLMLLGAVATQLGGLIQRKLIEAAHRNSEERLQLALEASDLGLWDWNLCTGKIYRDWQWKKMLGYGENEIAENQLANQELLHPQDLLAVKSAITDHLQGITPVYEMEFRMRCASGEWKWIQSRGQIVERNEQGVPLRMTGTHKDITERKILEKELELREARLKAFFSGAPVGMTILDNQLRFVQINELIADIHGHPITEHIGKTLQEIAPQIAPLVLPFCQQVLITNQPILNLELSIPASEEPDSLRHFLVSYFPIPGERNRPSGVGKVMVEISARKRAQEALKESAERERAIAQVIQRMRQTLDLAKIFTATTEELRQVLNCDRVVVYRFHPQWSGEFVAESVETGWISLIEEYQNDPHLTQGTLKSDRCSLKMFHHAGKQLQKNYPQSPEGTSFLCVPDIYQAGFDSCYLKFLERLQAKAYIIVPILCGDQLWGLLASYQNSSPRQWKTGEINIVVQIGNQLGVALQQAQLLEQTQRQSQALQAAVIAADAANSAKSEFLANMSHELRTPLNAILGFTQIMSQDKTLSAENQQNLSIINRAGEHLLNLINDILEMSKIEAGKTTLNINNFDLMSLLDNLEEMLLNRATAKGLQLQFIYAANLPQHIQTDENKLRQVLLNIIGNAIKFTETGTVTLRVSLEKRGQGDKETRGQGDKGSQHRAGVSPVEVTGVTRGQGENTYIDSFPPSPHLPLPLSPPSPSSLLFEIQDTGIGIFPAELDFLFDAFAQTESGRKSQQGTGLGLAISRKYVELMGGVISVSSTVGVGSTFRFSLPVGLVAAADVSVASHPLAVIGLAPHQAQYRILVVDDVADSRLLLVKLLSSVGFFVLEATNGDEAVALWQHWHPQLIFMDMRMPVMDGYAATRLIRSLEVDSHLHTVADTPIFPSVHTFIIAVTAHAFAEQRQDILLAGCDDLIYKPFAKEQILEKLSKYLGVQYLYQEGSYQQTKSEEKFFVSDDVLPLLSQMPKEWLIKVYNAAAQCSDDLVLPLIEEIIPENTTLKAYFLDLAHNFQFEKIMAIVSRAKGNS